MIVYRIETLFDGRGPWRSRYVPQWIESKLNDIVMPSPLEDGIDYFGTDDMVGCRSVEELKRWFPTDLIIKMLDDEYRIVLYHVPDKHVKFGDNQIVFDIVFAEKLHEHDELVQSAITLLTEQNLHAERELLVS